MQSSTKYCLTAIICTTIAASASAQTTNRYQIISATTLDATERIHISVTLKIDTQTGETWQLVMTEELETFAQGGGKSHRVFGWKKLTDHKTAVAEFYRTHRSDINDLPAYQPPEKDKQTTNPQPLTSQTAGEPILAQ